MMTPPLPMIFLWNCLKIANDFLVELLEDGYLDLKVGFKKISGHIGQMLLSTSSVGP